MPREFWLASSIRSGEGDLLVTVGGEQFLHVPGSQQSISEPVPDEPESIRPLRFIKKRSLRRPRRASIRSASNIFTSQRNFSVFNFEGDSEDCEELSLEETSHSELDEKEESDNSIACVTLCGNNQYTANLNGYTFVRDAPVRFVRQQNGRGRRHNSSLTSPHKRRFRLQRKETELYCSSTTKRCTYIQPVKLHCFLNLRCLTT